MTAEGLKKKEIISTQGGYVSTPSGDSMRPMLQGKRDSILVKAAIRPIRRGDVLLYEMADGTHVLHRVIAVTKEGYKMRGDNCYAPEPLLQEDGIIGVLEGFWRKDRYYACDSHKGYRFYVALWLVSFPLRRFCVRVKNKLKRIFGK